MVMNIMTALLKIEGVETADRDHCVHGLESFDTDGTGLVLKPTRWMSNSECILREVSAI